ncbi:MULTISPECIES: DUF4126 domain-containing protein [Microbacterium]|uniref:DUF4126 domain-containing protein n=1 Tax=Microbacterium TaxID=33882 RepID=UPI00217D065B|nr:MULTISPECIES: DUF4126 domain-containing protein [Microbacterium]UWF76740.1 DUF4126 domain-containing protein [Microbacterium neungamense]WCM54890.1 DUF4126 domain-containing protein [Microbacterium sp. EF45047]
MIEFLIGTSLAASAGLNAWMPLFLLGLADRLLPPVQLPSAWAWLSSDPALWIIGALLVLEIVADKIPALDSVNDIVQSVIRPAAGGIAFGAGAGAETLAVGDPAAFFADNAWVPVALGIAVALVVHVVKASTRVAANTTTAGMAGPVLSTAEDGTSFLLAALALTIPVLAGVVLIALVMGVVAITRRLRRRRERTRSAAGGIPT